MYIFPFSDLWICSSRTIHFIQLHCEVLLHINLWKMSCCHHYPTKSNWNKLRKKRLNVLEISNFRINLKRFIAFNDYILSFIRQSQHFGSETIVIAGNKQVVTSITTLNNKRRKLKTARNVINYEIEPLLDRSPMPKFVNI